MKRAAAALALTSSPGEVDQALERVARSRGYDLGAVGQALRACSRAVVAGDAERAACVALQIGLALAEERLGPLAAHGAKFTSPRPSRPRRVARLYRDALAVLKCCGVYSSTKRVWRELLAIGAVYGTGERILWVDDHGRPRATGWAAFDGRLSGYRKRMREAAIRASR